MQTLCHNLSVNVCYSRYKSRLLRLSSKPVAVLLILWYSEQTRVSYEISNIGTGGKSTLAKLISSVSCTGLHEHICSNTANVAVYKHVVID